MNLLLTQSQSVRLVPPAVQRPALRPGWLWITNTLPLLILLGLMGSHYTLIRPLLSPESRTLWGYFGAGLVGLATLTAACTAWWSYRRQELPVWYGLVALAAYSAFLFAYLDQMRQLLPGHIPGWLTPPFLSTYPWTFFMPTLAHAMLVLIVWSIPEQGRKSPAGLNGLAAGLVLGLTYVFFNLADVEVGALTFFLGAAVFLFFIGRGAYQMARRRSRADEPLALGWRVLAALVLPVLGLLVNQGFSLGFSNSFHEVGVFGNFSHPAFWVLATANGVLLSIPDPAQRSARLAVALGRAALLPFTLYFFLVLLPYLPLSIFAILAIGLGFLMLAPLLLLPLHLSAIGRDLRELRVTSRRPTAVSLLVFASILTLPLAVVLRDLHHRRTLHRALAHVLTPDYAASSADAPLDATSLKTTLELVRKQKRSGSDDVLLSAQQPYLTALFSWLVLDNLTLPDSRLRLLEEVFLGAPLAAPQPPDRLMPAAGPRLTKLAGRSRYDARQQTWRSWVDLTIHCPPALQANGPHEYVATLDLPPGAWVSDYYLDMEGRREHGILAEAKAAEWVYAQIVSDEVPRDPGLLRLTRGGEGLSLRVFPFQANEVRRSGFELLHKAPLTLTLDGHGVQLGDPTHQELSQEIATPDSQAVYVSATAKRRLPQVWRQPYLHFLLDVSKDNPAGRKAAIRQIEDVLSRQPDLARSARFTLVNAYARTLPAGTAWQQEFLAAPAGGGFYVAGAVQQSLAMAARHPTRQYPVPVVVTDSPTEGLLADERTQALARLCPEPFAAYALSAGHAGLQPLAGPGSSTVLNRRVAVRAWPAKGPIRAYLPDDERPGIVLTHPDAPVSLPDKLPAREWNSGLLLLAHHRSTQVLHPQLTDTQRPAGVRASFQARLLTPLTALLALENETQKIALQRMQEQVLASNVNLAPGEEMLDENRPAASIPIDGGIGWLIAAGALLAFRHHRRGLPSRKTE